MRGNPGNELASAIRAVFRESGWSIKRLATESGIAYASAFGFAKGTRDISTGVASRLCKALGLQLTTRKGRKPK